MKVILQTELRGKGGEGDVIDVADGYANNWLFPQRIAIRATEGNLKQLEQKRNNIAKREAVRVSDAESFKEKIEGKTVRVIAKVGDEGQLYGSVTAAQVADAAMEQLGIELDRKRIEVKSIKVAGIHPVTVNLYRQIEATIYVDVNDEAGFAAVDAENAVEEVEEVVEETVEEVAETADAE